MDGLGIAAVRELLASALTGGLDRRVTVRIPVGIRCSGLHGGVPEFVQVEGGRDQDPR